VLPLTSLKLVLPVDSVINIPDYQNNYVKCDAFYY